MNKNRALLLDRDGVINEDHAYVGSIDTFGFIPGLFPFLRSARDLGYRLAILTNQSGVARGFYSEESYHTLTNHMLSALKREQIDIDLTLACFAHSEGTVREHKRESYWRKPNPGMVLEASRRLDLDPVRSAFLGDKLSDMDAARGGFIGTCLWFRSDHKEAPAGVTCVDTYEQALTALTV